MRQETVEKLRKIIIDDERLSKEERNAKLRSLDILLGYNPNFEEDEEFLQLLSDAKEFINDDSMTVADFVLEHYGFDKNVTSEEVKRFFDKRIEGILNFINKSNNEEMVEQYRTILTDTFADWKIIDDQLVNGRKEIEATPTIQQERYDAKIELNNFINQAYGIEPAEVSEAPIINTVEEVEETPVENPTYDEVFSAPEVKSAPVVPEVKPTPVVVEKTNNTKPGWDPRLTEEQILDAYSRDIYEPVGQEYEMFLREHGLDPIKVETKTEPKWDPRLTDEQIAYAYSRDIYEPVGPEYEMFLSDLGLSKPSTTVEPVKEEKVEEPKPVIQPENTVLKGDNKFDDFLNNMSARATGDKVDEKVETPVVKEESKPKTFAEKIKTIKDHVKQYVNGIILGLSTLRNYYIAAIEGKLGLTDDESKEFTKFYKDRHDSAYSLSNKLFKTPLRDLPEISRTIEPVEEVLNTETPSEGRSRLLNRELRPVRAPRLKEDVVEAQQNIEQTIPVPEIVHVPLREEYEEKEEPAITEEEIKERFGEEVSSSTDDEREYVTEDDLNVELDTPSENIPIEDDEDVLTEDDFKDVERTNPDEPILTEEQLQKKSLYDEKGEIESNEPEKVVQNREEQYSQAFETKPQEPTEKSAVDVLFEVKEEMEKEKNASLTPEELKTDINVEGINEEEFVPVSVNNEEKESNNIHEITSPETSEKNNDLEDYINNDIQYASEEDEMNDIIRMIDDATKGKTKTTKPQKEVKEEVKEELVQEELNEPIEKAEQTIEEPTETEYEEYDDDLEDYEEVEEELYDEDLLESEEYEDTAEDEKMARALLHPEEKVDDREIHLTTEEDQAALREMVKVRARRIPPVEKIGLGIAGMLLTAFGLASVNAPATAGGALVTTAAGGFSIKDIMVAIKKSQLKEMARQYELKLIFDYENGKIIAKNLDGSEISPSKKENINRDYLDEKFNKKITSSSLKPKVTIDNLEHLFVLNSKDDYFYVTKKEAKEYDEMFGNNEPIEVDEDEYVSFDDVHGDSLENQKGNVNTYDKSIMQFIDVLNAGMTDENGKEVVPAMNLKEGIQIHHDHNDDESDTYLSLTDEEKNRLNEILSNPYFIDKYGKYNFVEGSGIYGTDGYPFFISVMKRDIDKTNVDEESLRKELNDELEDIKSTFRR
ncbi:MAG: hypothetical protein IKP76_00770 [Bacilli bacterium]|nr:hypothetical protein [Bacilli bacterium]